MTASRQKLRAAVLISGGGTNLQAFIDAVAAGTLALDLSIVVSNVADAYGLERASRAGIETRVFLPEYAALEINSPGEPGVSYHMGIGFTASQVPEPALSMLLALAGAIPLALRRLAV